LEGTVAGDGSDYLFVAGVFDTGEGEQPLRAQRVVADTGAILDPGPILSTGGVHPALSAGSTYLLAWQQEGAIFATRFHPGGPALDPQPGIAVFPTSIFDGSFAVAFDGQRHLLAWSNAEVDTMSTISANWILAASGARAGDTPTEVAVAPSGGTKPAVASDGRGGALIAYQRAGIRLRRLHLPLGTAATGGSCGSDFECATGFCVEGLCCDAPCAAPCGVCARARGAERDGHCTILENTACDDGNLCTRQDRCRSGACVGEDPVSCSALDDCHAAGRCNRDTGQCTNPTRPNGSSCPNGICQAGVCSGGLPPMDGPVGLPDGGAPSAGGNGDDGGCSTAPRSPARGAAALLILALFLWGRRRRTDQRP
jgi:MYXO-CTERM domain-containing protein